MQNNSNCVAYHPLPPPPPAFGPLFPLVYIVGVLVVALFFVILAARANNEQKKLTCLVREADVYSSSSPKPINILGMLTAVFGLVGAVGIILYWCTFFTSASTMVVTCDWYVVYESSFPLADGATGPGVVGP